MKMSGSFTLMLLGASYVAWCGVGTDVKAASRKSDSLVGDRSSGRIYKSTESERAIVIRRAGAGSVHFTILDGAVPSSKVLEGLATRINEGLDPDTGADVDGIAYPLDTYVYSEPQCYFEIGVGQSPEFDSNLEVSSCACRGVGNQSCPLEDGVLYIRQEGVGGL
ncbi:hypothetical protein [Montanilutibacter psychrotolerans]|uniref:hypothetical protein n=1 Tax=Montanilutibacter psychrotolerans TaxID=1327343 RepID=UPI0011CE09BA|nr:hypothetical protein [Lysobacter psychrotolerans]